MDKMASVHLCLGTLTILALIGVPAVRGKPFLAQENELFPEKDDAANQDMLLSLLLNRNPGLRRPANLDLEFADKLEGLGQLEKLKEKLLQAKSPEAVQGLSLSHANKRGFAGVAGKPVMTW